MALALCTALAAQPAGPTHAPSGPGVRNAHGLAFDGQHTVLFGGATERAVVADTWGWDGHAWRLLASTGPAGRTFPVMVSAPGAGAVLFGGRRVLFGTGVRASEFLDDLWTWTGQAWSPASPSASAPPGRAEAAGAWDPRRRRLVIFGGYTAREGEIDLLGDTWEFGDGRWHQFVPSVAPSPRHGAAAWFDEALAEVVLFGGNGASAEMWSWNGTRWRRRGDADMPGRYNIAVSAGEADLPVLLFGGWNGRARTGDTWTWRDGVGRRLFATKPAPSPRNHATVAFDRRRGRYVLVGGHDGRRVFGDVWEADQRGWERRLAVPALRRIGNAH